MTDEPTPGNVKANPYLAEFIELHENTNWSYVPGSSAVEAGTRTAYLFEAHEPVQWSSVMERQGLLRAAVTPPEVSVPASSIATDGSSDDTNDDSGEPGYGRNAVMNTSGRLATWTDGNYDTTRP